MFSGTWPRMTKAGITVKHSTRKSRSSHIQHFFSQLVINHTVYISIAKSYVLFILTHPRRGGQLSKNVSNDQSNHTNPSSQKYTKMFKSHNSGSICTTGKQDMCSASRDGLELRPASGKHDGKAGRKCYSRLQATVQQTNSSGVMVQKQPALHSHKSCGCTS